MEQYEDQDLLQVLMGDFHQQLLGLGIQRWRRGMRLMFLFNHAIS